MKLYSNCALLSLLFVALPLQAAHPFLCCDHNGGKVCVVSAEGKIEWEYACKSPQDCWRLANGNYLFCFFSGAIEITPDKKIVWVLRSWENPDLGPATTIQILDETEAPERVSFGDIN